MKTPPLAQLAVTDVLIAPSILASDFSRLGDEIRAAEAAGADLMHVDVMDGHFVPNLTLGPPVVKSIRPCSSLPYDVHLMLDNPEDFVEPFAEAGADVITIHVEVGESVAETLRRIRELGCSPGLSLRPGTPAESLFPYLDAVDLILVMTVEPGFGGQKFRHSMLDKIRSIRAAAEERERSLHLEVDGGINRETAPLALEAGANMLVAGTSVFRSPDGYAAAIKALRGVVA